MSKSFGMPTTHSHALKPRCLLSTCRRSPDHDRRPQEPAVSRRTCSHGLARHRQHEQSSPSLQGPAGGQHGGPRALVTLEWGAVRANGVLEAPASKGTKRDPACTSAEEAWHVVGTR